MLVKAQQGSLGAGIWRGEKSSYQYFMLRSKQTMFLLPWCLKKTIYSKGISNTVVTYFNCNLTKRPRGQGIILSSFYWEGKSVTIFPPTNRRETFLILQIGLCSSHVFNEKSSGFQLSTVDYSDLGVALNGMGRCSFWKHFIPAPTSCDCETNPPRLHQNAPNKAPLLTWQSTTQTIWHWYHTHMLSCHLRLVRNVSSSAGAALDPQKFINKWDQQIQGKVHSEKH